MLSVIFSYPAVCLLKEDTEAEEQEKKLYQIFELIYLPFPSVFLEMRLQGVQLMEIGREKGPW